VQAQTDELEEALGGDVKKCRRRLTSSRTHSVWCEEVQAQTDELEDALGGDVKKCRRRLTSLRAHSVVV